ncbi:efflux RND transporter permease subunit [Hyunsoonleella ulvae]|uniref:efflux RND transporter permease subunit n=1 Tax=Hyunsoonleella ulvae TaxID=2799948 RepID=UPI00193966D5|nr:efflux RND transporter permease subunit [Hyunsoonleella ulvae]
MVKFLTHKPIAVLMTTLGVLILGAYALNFIPVSLMPDIDIPEVTVQVQADNMSARQMEDAIVKPMRSRLMQVSHLKDIKSEASNESGVVRLSFTHGSNIDYAFIEVNEKIDRLANSLPKTVDRPKVIKASATDIPVFYLSMTIKAPQKTSKTGNPLFPVSQEFVDFNRFVNQVIKRRIEQVEEVAMVDINGLVASEILIIPDQDKLNALGIRLSDIESVIEKNDLDIGSLLIKDNQYQYDIRLGTSLTDIKDIESIYINKGNRVFQLKELAEIIEHPQNRTGLVLSEGDEAVTMAIIKQSDAKMNDLKASLSKLIDAFKKDYPQINFSITRDQTKLLDYAINNLFQSLLWGMLLAFAVMFLFLKNVKSPLLIGITIPASILVSLLFFHLLNISINIISLSGLVLGIGLMIDNSIIVIDNIEQFRTRGHQLSKACVMGTNEVIKPLLSSALTTCAVFIPLVFLSGISGSLFYDQAMAVSIGLFISLLVSVTLLPTLYRLFHLKERKRSSRVTRFLEKVNRFNYEAFYEKGFRFIMRRQKLSWGISFLFLALSISLFSLLPKKQMPVISTTETLLQIDWNEQINVEENKRRSLELLQPIKPQLVNQTALVGTQQFILDKNADAKTSETTIYLNAETEIDINTIKSNLNKTLIQKFPNAVYNYSNVDNIFSLIFSSKEAPLVARLRHIENLGSAQNHQLKTIWHQLNKSTENIALKPIAWQEYMTLVADQEKLITYNINSNTLFNTLKSAFNAHEVLTIADNQQVMPIILGGKTKYLEAILSETMVASRDSTLFQIKDFVKVSKAQDLKRISGGVVGEYYPVEFNVKDNEIENTIDNVKKIVNKNTNYETSFSGSFFSNLQLMDELKVVLLISLLLLYFILASQFESFVLPLIILLEVPIDLAGAFLFLKLFGMSINLMSMIGIVVMSGIIINDSILKIDTIIQLQRQGHPLLKALLVAGQRRLKPILMTSLTTILALVPLLLTGGLGAELQAPLAVALIGGMLLGTVVSLYFIPLCYYHFTRKK